MWHRITEPRSSVTSVVTWPAEWGATCLWACLLWSWRSPEWGNWANWNKVYLARYRLVLIFYLWQIALFVQYASIMGNWVKGMQKVYIVATFLLIYSYSKQYIHLLFLTCMCMCPHVYGEVHFCAQMHMYMNVHACGCLWRSENGFRCHSWSIIHVGVGSRVSHWSGAHQESRMHSQWAFGICLSPHSWCWDFKHMPAWPWVLGIEVRSSCLLSKHYFTDWALSQPQ